MRIDNIFILLSLILIFIVACSSIQPKNTADSCLIFSYLLRYKHIHIYQYWDFVLYLSHRRLVDQWVEYDCFFAQFANIRFPVVEFTLTQFPVWGFCILLNIYIYIYIMKLHTPFYLVLFIHIGMPSWLTCIPSWLLSIPSWFLVTIGTICIDNICV